MYFNKKNSFLHGIMFHNFHDNKIHPYSQGSLDKFDLKKLINFVGVENIVNPNEFIQLIKNKDFNLKKVCLTFDDGILSQLDIALPILNKYNLKAFFFPHTAIFINKTDNLELFRYFRNSSYKKIDNFYNDFFSSTGKNLDQFFLKYKKVIKIKKKKHSCYSINDIKFRLVRDFMLSKNEYNKIMFSLFKKKMFNYKKVSKNLFIKKSQLKKIYNSGHVIGLHSHTHPTRIEKKNFNEQLLEYNKNISLLSKILNIEKNDIKSAAHPSGSYNSNTKKIFKLKKIQLAFKEIMTKDDKTHKINNSIFEVAREEASNIMANLK